jgi:hypothetical protein
VDGYDGATVRFFAVRSTDHDEGKNAFCFTRVYDERRSQWAKPPSEYSMIWVARSCATVVGYEGEPTEFDREPVHTSDGYREGESRTEADLDVDLMLAKARRRVARRQEGEPGNRFGDALDRIGERPNGDAMTKKVSCGVVEFASAYSDLKGGEPEDEELAAFVEGVEAMLDHTPSDDE